MSQSFCSGRSLRRALLNSVVPVAVLVSGAAYAQQEDPATPVSDAAEADVQGSPGDRIVVTGSRIARNPNVVAPVPVQSVDAEDITLSGDVNIVDVVNDLPALIGSSNTADNAGSQGLLGAATLNLRNLGTNRTLTLIDGRRHVPGVAGTAAVDVNTIPAALVQRVEVLTGGASAVYGADAVTGVVNFILRDDFDGADLRAQYNVADDGDAATYYASGTLGRNFDSDRGNVTFNVTYEKRDNLQQGDREHVRGDRVGTDWPHPNLFIQQADIDQYGLDQLLLGDDVAFYCDPGDTTLGAGKDALCSRADNSPGRLVGPFPRFNLSSYGSLIGVDFYGFEFLAYYPGTPTTDIFGSSYPGIDLGGDGLIFDLNNNGIEDCLETVNGTILQRFGGFAGCHVSRAPGSIDVFQDGLIAGSQNAFGGDGTYTGRDAIDILPSDERVTLHFTSNYEFTPNLRWFVEAKYSSSETINNGTQGVQAFFDSHVIEWDNPFIPMPLRNAITTFVNDNPGIFVLEDVNILLGRDVTDMGPAITFSDREVFRIVTGFEGQIGQSAFDYEVYANYGETQADTRTTGNILIDRYYAAADVVLDGSGNPVCRSELDPTATPSGSFLRSAGPFRGFLTFTPGTGLCQPLNLFGVGAPSQEAIDFVTTDLNRQRTITQTVLSGVIVGDSSDLFSLPAGPVGLAFGLEYREEESEFYADPLERPRPDPLGIVPAFTPLFAVDAPVDNTFGSFDVTEIFGEFSAPLLAGKPFAEELTLEGAYRYSEYSTLGGTESWNTRLSWAPHQDLRFRGTLSQTVRAPNINELFSPLQATTARPTDPCDAGEINNGTSNRPANCAADGIPSGFTDPLTARISGFTGGNPNLDVETADTRTIGFVFQPSFLEGLTFTLDYYDIEIEDAIAAPGLQQIVNACYDATTFPNQFCDLFSRDRDPASPTFLGFETFTTTQLNFASVQTSGFDYEVVWTFELGDVFAPLDPYGSLALSVVGNHTEKLERFEDPTDATIVNDLLYENGQPADVVNLGARWVWGDLTINWQSRYYGEFLEITPRLEIENVDNFENAWTGEIWRHDISGSYTIDDRVQVYGGVNNVFEEDPILTSVSYPVGVIGREIFVGVNVAY
ncbi:TonB-dependent receptor [Marinicauda algicola]|uniref:TonB-dependent receptor n=1 Tax=Marinicauda algicola TaxID=2029849 RepID=A0A4V6RF51_9PROT|nr:TonB-dependent receptor [Marinicauda algicola]TGY89229.1 TonB-dependent receptor [Marinicauda algicola]